MAAKFNNYILSSDFGNKLDEAITANAGQSQLTTLTDLLNKVAELEAKVAQLESANITE